MRPPAKKTIRYFGDYVLFGQIAEGAMGEVWFARQDSLNRPVALKLIRAGTLATAADIERFRVEAHAAARLSHKNIVQVFEVGEHEGRHFLSMELVEGDSLAGQIKRGAWSFVASNARQRQCQIASLLATVSRAVHHAHQRGVLHRDIKPANILIDERGEPHLSDFGLAKLLDATSSLTASVAVLGTLSYMSPEQAAGKSAEATTAADIYSLGAVLYELLADQPPFRDGNWAELLRKVMSEAPVPPRRIRKDECRTSKAPDLNQPSSSALRHFINLDLETVCLKCLEKSPVRRYPSAEALAEDLERWLRGEPIVARPVGDFERACKWIHRHPVTAGLSAALAGAMLVGLATTTWQWRRADNQRALTAAAHARLQLQRAEDFFGSERAQLALPVLARVLRDNPYDRVTQERLVNGLTQRGFLVPMETPGRVPSDAVQLALRVARSPEGARLATATNAEMTAIHLSDARSGNLLHSFANAHSNVIRSLVFSPDGQRLASSSADATAKIWRAETPGLLVTLPHPAAVHSAEFSPDGQRVLTACRDGVARVWNAQTGAPLLALPPQRAALTIARFHPDAPLLAIGAEDGTVQLWIWAPNGVRRFTEPLSLSNAVWNLKFRSQSLIATLDDGTTHTLSWTHPFSSLTPSERETAGVRGPQIPTRTPEPPQPIPTVLGQPATQFHPAPITMVDTSAAGRLVATASLDKTARIWDARTLAPVTEPLVHVAPVNCVRFSQDGLRLATSTVGGIARVWDAETGQPLTDWIHFELPVVGATFSADDTRLETSSGETWPIYCARAPAPPWLPELAEVIGGSRLGNLGRAIPAAPFAAIRQGLTHSTETNTLVLWAKELLQGAPARP